MCAISASPEAGDAIANIMSRKRCSAISVRENSKCAYLPRRDKSMDVLCIPMISSNPVDNANNGIHEKLSLIRDDLSRRTSDIEHEIDRYGGGLPYYRSVRLIYRLSKCEYQNLIIRCDRTMINYSRFYEGGRNSIKLQTYQSIYEH